MNQEKKINYIIQAVKTLNIDDKTSIAIMIKKYNKNLINKNPDGIRVSFDAMTPELIDQIYNWLQTKKI
jgi:molybdenum cofactor biosynthesis enzyme MoaA